MEQAISKQEAKRMSIIEGGRANTVEMPKIGDSYWTYYINPKSQFEQVIETVWTGGFVDMIRIKDGRIYNAKGVAMRAAELAR